MAKRGRKKKPVKTTPAPAPAAPADQDATGWLGLAGDAIRARLAAGKALPHHEAKLLREVAWAAKHADYWPDLKTAAGDLGVSESTMRSWVDQGCAGIEPHMPVHRASVLAWLLKHAAERGANPPATKQTAEDADARWKLARAAKVEGALIAEAEDRATQGVLAAVSEARAGLVERVPSSVASAHPYADASSLAEAIRAAIDGELARLAATPIRPPVTQETP